MENKAFMFMPAWITPLEALTPEERWNVVACIVEYASEGSVSITLSPIAGMAFAYISADIDRMKSKYNSVCEKRKAAAESRWAKKESNVCKSTSRKPKADKLKTETETETETETVAETETKKTSSTSTGVRMRGNAGKETTFDDSQLLERFFDSSNQARIEAIAMQHHVEISDLRRMAEEITVQWALSDKTHDTYQDASLHLQYALAEKANRERKSRLQAIADGAIPQGATKGMLGIDEYIDSEGRRTYNGVDFIPNDAPPRPGRAFYWNKTTNSWDDIQ